MTTEPTTNGEGSLRDAFLKAPRPSLSPVVIPECRITVYVIPLKSKEKDAFERSLVEGRGRNKKQSSDNIRAKYCARCMADEHGNRLFADNEYELIGDLPAGVVERVFAEISRVNGATDDDIEELAGNLPRGRAGSTS